MFYFNTRYTFPLPEGSPPDVSGGILAASAMPQPNLRRRDLRKSHYLQRRLLDPQLYLATLPKLTAQKCVAKLGTYPWFRCTLEDFESGRTGGLPGWHKAQSAAVLDSWPGAPATAPDEIATCARSCVQFQVELGCEAIILPSPMTRQVNAGYQLETAWLDAGLAAVAELRVNSPVYATIAIADTALQQLKPRENLLLQTITAHVSARAKLAGGYVVIAQDSEPEDSYTCQNPDTLLSLLLIVDDLVRSGKDVIVNGVGTFGIAAAAVGARIWSSGYYRSQRRVRTSDFNDTEGRTVPRYFSRSLLADVGVEHDLALLAKDPTASRILTPTPLTDRLHRALLGDGTMQDVPEWQYAPGAPTAAMAHYVHCMQMLASHVDSLASRDARVGFVRRLLGYSTLLADRVRAVVTNKERPDGAQTRHTDFQTPAIWKSVFDDWASGE